MEIIPDGINRLHIAEKLVKLEGKTIENNQNETQREKKKENSKIWDLKRYWFMF